MAATPPTASHRMPAVPASSWRWWPADVVLGFMLSGLLVGPVFSAAGGPLLGPIGAWVYWLGLAICPEPLHHFPQLAGHTAIVCTRCLFAILGLVMVRWLYARPQRLKGWWAAWGWPQRLAVALSILALWQLDVHAGYAGWWDSVPWVQALSGALVGLVIGLLVYPVLVWLSGRFAERRV